MSKKIYEDRAGRQVVQFESPIGPQLEIWANPWHLTPDEARVLSNAIFQWATENDEKPAGPVTPARKSSTT